MITGVTSSGYKYKVNEDILSDWRVVKELAKLKGFEDIDEEDTDRILDFINVMASVEGLIFKDGGKGLEKHILRHNNGVVAPLVLFQDLMDIFKASKEAKNSLSSPT